MKNSLVLVNSGALSRTPGPHFLESPNEWALKQAKAATPEEAFMHIFMVLGAYGLEEGRAMLNAYLIAEVLTRNHVIEYYASEGNRILTLSYLHACKLKKKNLFSLEELFELDDLRAKNNPYGEAACHPYKEDIPWLLRNEKLLEAAPSELLLRWRSHITDLDDRMTLYAEFQRRMKLNQDKKLLRKVVPIEDEVMLIRAAAKQDPHGNAVKRYITTVFLAHSPRKGNLREHMLLIISALLERSPFDSPGFHLARDLSKWYLHNKLISKSDRDWLANELREPSLRVGEVYRNFVDDILKADFLSLTSFRRGWKE